MTGRGWAIAYPERWHRFRRTAGPDMWDIDSAVTHAARRGQTACGVAVWQGKNAWEKAWDSAEVTCKRCLRSMRSNY